MIYNSLTLKYFHKPVNVGVFNEQDPAVITAYIGSKSNGQAICLQLKLNSQAIIVDACFKAYGPVPVIAMTSWLTEWVLNKPIIEAGELSSEFLMNLFELPNTKRHCALIVEDVMKLAIKKYMDNK